MHDDEKRDQSSIAQERVVVLWDNSGHTLLSPPDLNTYTSQGDARFRGGTHCKQRFCFVPEEGPSSVATRDLASPKANNHLQQDYGLEQADRTLGLRFWQRQWQYEELEPFKPNDDKPHRCSPILARLQSSCTQLLRKKPCWPREDIQYSRSIVYPLCPCRVTLLSLRKFAGLLQQRLKLRPF